MNVQEQEAEQRPLADAWLEPAQAGDAKAFERLLGHYYGFIFSVAYRWLGNRSDAEDVTQNVCMKLAQALPGFDRRSAFSSWLYRITINTAYDLQRSQNRRARVAGALHLVADDRVLAEQESRLHVQDIWAMVRRLPQKQRDAVLLVYGEQLSQAQAAEIMNCKEGTVSWHIHEARKALKEML